MDIKTFQVGPLETNCYVVSSPTTKEAVVIDPGDEAHLILDYIRTEGLLVKYILNTHGHNDHVGDNDIIRKETQALVAIHSDDHELILNPQKTASKFVINAQPGEEADILLHNKDEIIFGDIRLEVIYTPGHTKGGCCFYTKDHQACFTGDTLFRGTIGRCDLYGGDYSTLMESITKRLACVSDDTDIYPGHGYSSTMKIERKINPYFKS